tara:strand:- start:31480 stop:33075 length:1596 start_codon:yes stop_codon:yes gene_type:complete
MKDMMQAAKVVQFGQPLSIQECEIPTPLEGQILVKTEACGVCHTDLHAAAGDWPLKPTLPFTPGHEGIGKVVALGAGVDQVKVGERVGVPWLYSACGHCEYCLSAWETVCADAEFGGYSKDGGFAEYIIADPRYVAHIPAGLSAIQAAPIICAGVTSYKGIKETGAKPGQWLVVLGCGGLGHLAIQYAKAMGLKVCAVDIDDSKLEHAKGLGADAVVNAFSQDAAVSVKHVTNGGAHGVLITAPSMSAFKEGVEMTRKTGTCVLVGLPPGEFPTDLFDVVANCKTIKGSFVGTRQDMAEALAFAADGKVKADIELCPLSDVNHVLNRLKAGEVAARIVLDFTDNSVGNNEPLVSETTKHIPGEVCEHVLDGKKITIRPISEQDKQLESEFVNGLSAQTKHYRFLGGINTLSDAMLKTLCTIDGQNSMAFVATEHDSQTGAELEIGESRYAFTGEHSAYEIAVTISDKWQHKGLGKLLTEHLIEYAKVHNVGSLYAIELADNHDMRKLAGELGMTEKMDRDDAHQVIYSLTL